VKIMGSSGRDVPQEEIFEPDVAKVGSGEEVL
jgi:hypothetical protein